MHLQRYKEWELQTVTPFTVALFNCFFNNASFLVTWSKQKSMLAKTASFQNDCCFFAKFFMQICSAFSRFLKIFVLFIVHSKRHWNLLKDPENLRNRHTRNYLRSLLKVRLFQEILFCTRVKFIRENLWWIATCLQLGLIEIRHYRAIFVTLENSFVPENFSTFRSKKLPSKVQKVTRKL